MTEDFDKAFGKKLFQTFSFTIDFLKKNNLTYYACGGTALGAVRHKGIIPWDDDIDIYMPRKDYDKLLDMTAELEGTGYKLSSYRDEGYYLPFAKIEDLNSSIWEYPQFKYIIGVYVDIFPMDSFDLSEEEVIKLQYSYQRLWWNYQHSLNSMNLIDTIKSKDHRLRHSYLMHKLLWWKKNSLHKQIAEREKWYATQSGKHSVSVCTWQGKVFQTEWFKKPIEVPFNDLKVLIPNDYDAYLTKLYGDYMTPPPPKERVMAHEALRFYCNLTRRVTCEEALEDIKNNKRIII